MLAQNFKTADELKITAEQHTALISVLYMLERKELVHALKPEQGKFPENGFNMSFWCQEDAQDHEVAECGTAMCIGGWANALGAEFGAGDYAELPRNLYKLFFPFELQRWEDIKPAQAATALRSYLTTGNAQWDEAMKVTS